ncbi:MAG TPA: hypothetical protein VGN14_00685 [Candidatus Elarobacter sp.]|jgi:hypothetical protein
MTRIAAALGIVVLSATAAAAQSYPGDSGAGVQRGVEQVNNSGQVGTVTLFRGGVTTRVEIALQGTTAKPESVRIYRGPSCADLSARPVFVLADVKNGISRSSIAASADTLLSGNYDVVIFANNRAGARAAACGHLYR